ncbi:MAG: response regulator transcription factor [Archangium sp.]|nr:response regulator transcription factor [Archangium sp.]
MTSRVLVVEDDSTLRLALCDNLEDEGYAVTPAATLAEARKQLSSAPPDVVVLDLMLPDGDGTTLCRELRKAKTTARILMLTARTLEDDLVKGFEAGADDYLAKPYRLRELLARIGALARRRATTTTDTKHAVGEWTVDESARTVTDAKGKEVELTRKEFDLLVFLIRAGDAVATRDAILDAIWGDVVVDTHTVDNFISSLKKKLKLDVKTVRGVGFRLGKEK